MVEFGADSFYYPLVGEDEEIFVDEVEDGLAACAEEQAKLWAAQAQEEGRSLDYVVSLVEKLQTVKKKRGGCTRIHSLCFVRSDAVRCVCYRDRFSHSPCWVESNQQYRIQEVEVEAFL